MAAFLSHAIALLTLSLPPLAADLETIQRELSQAWRADGPARKFRAKCLITLEMEVKPKDESMGDPYFPNPGDNPNTAVPAKRWREEIARQGNKYFGKFTMLEAESVTWPSPRAGSGSDMSGFHFFDGGGASWTYMPFTRSAEKHPGVTPLTMLNQDYYGDVIGFPGKLVSATRSVAGELSEPYQLDQLIPTGKYAIRGEEAVGSEPCVVLERPGLDRLWLSKEKGWAVVKREWNWTVGGPLKRRITNSDFQKLTDQVWLPYQSQMEILGHPNSRPGRRVGVMRIAVEELEADVADAQFEAREIIPRGTVVTDLATGIVSRFGMENEGLAERMNRLSPYRPQFRPEPWWSSPWLWGAIGIVVLAVVASIWWRRQR